MLTLLTEIAADEVGTKEVGGNNCGKKIRAYQAATNLEPAAWPWCAAFVCWCIREWIADPAAVKWLNLQSSTPEDWRPTTAAAFGLIAWAKKRPRTVQILNDRQLAKAGDIVVFDFSHCGIVESATTQQLYTIEGNTNGRGDRESTSGDGVWRKQRPATLAQAFLRIRTAK